MGCEGCQLFVDLNGSSLQTAAITSLKYLNFMEMMSNGKLLEPEGLVPTKRA